MGVQHMEVKAHTDPTRGPVFGPGLSPNKLHLYSEGVVKRSTGSLVGERVARRVTSRRRRKMPAIEFRIAPTPEAIATESAMRNLQTQPRTRILSVSPASEDHAELRRIVYD